MPHNILTALLTGFVLFFFSGCTAQTPDLESEKATLLALHQNVLQAHLDSDVEQWMQLEAAEYISANGGAITFPSYSDRQERRKNYLEQTTFSSYRDLKDPVVSVSADGTLGWLIAEVEAIGVQNTTQDSIHAIWAWIELYKKTDGEWKQVGNVSNSRPD